MTQDEIVIDRIDEAFAALRSAHFAAKVRWGADSKEAVALKKAMDVLEGI